MSYRCKFVDGPAKGRTVEVELFTSRLDVPVPCERADCECGGFAICRYEMRFSVVSTQGGSATRLFYAMEAD